MDFKSLIDFFRQDDWTEDLVAQFDEMLELGGSMFAYTMGVLVEGAADEDPQGAIFVRDRRINVLVRQIRRRVISHLSAGGRRDIPTALIFMNAVKDAERIGDYVKNLYEIKDLMPERPDRDLYRRWLAEPTAAVITLVEDTRVAFAESDQGRAGAVIEQTRRLGRECEAAIVDITGSEVSVRDAVCVVLALRFLKRIVSHLSNVATTVVMPVDLLDFHDEPRG